MLCVTMRDISLTATGLATRESIIENAETLLLRYGPTKTTVADVARVSGMSPANIYKFFSSKDDLIEAVGERFFAGLRSDITKITQSKGSAWHKIEMIIWKYHSALRRRLENEPHLLEVVALVHEKKLMFVTNFNSFVVACITRIIEQGIETKEFRPLDSVVSAQAIMDCVAFATHPIFIGDFSAKEHERRVTAQLSLLARAVSLQRDAV